VYRVSIGTRGF